MSPDAPLDHRLDRFLGRHDFAVDALGQGLLLDRIVAHFRELFGQFLNPVQAAGEFVGNV